jgi:hypothetical protein
MRLLARYTSGAGLLGILGSQSIRAGHVAYLSDSAEFRYAFDVARDVCERFTTLRETFAPKYPALADLITKETTHLERGSVPNIFVSSFSEVQDDLSQWRGYTNPGDGYTIEFDHENLEVQAADRGWRLEPVVYGRARTRWLLAWRRPLL